MKHPFFPLLFTIALASCGTDREQDPQYQQYVDDTRRAEAMVASRDSTINDLLATFNRISSNLRTIRARQGSLPDVPPGVEQNVDLEDRIMSDLRDIDSLLAENRLLMDRLRYTADVGARGIDQLQRTVLEMELTLKEQDEEINRMKEELASSNSTMATLIEMYRDKAQLAEQRSNELNTAYYTVGTMRELRSNGVLSREGGVAGIGGVDRLDVSTMPRDHFRRIDVTKEQEIPVVAKKARLITPHPDGSYRFENGAEKLVITDVEDFWSVSKYLVVAVE